MNALQVAERSAVYALQTVTPSINGETFDLMATAPEGVAKLRELILDLAVRGLLVTPNFARGSASALLQRIREAQAKLAEAGLTKRSRIRATVEESPFELPHGWKWVTLMELCATLTDGDHLPPPKADNGVPFLVIGDVRSGSIDVTTASRFVPRTYFESLDWSRQPQSGDILYTTVGSFGIPIPLVGAVDFCFQRHIALLRPALPELQAFLVLALASPFVFAQATTVATGTAQKTVPLSALRTFQIPLPPLAEQQRIVARVEELMGLCDELEAHGRLQDQQHARLVATLFDALVASASPEELASNWQRIASNFDLLLDRPEAVDALEQTILQLAVRGLLVPQNPADEPAAALLAHIRATKAQLVAKGELSVKKLLGSSGDAPIDSLPHGWASSSIAEIGIVNPRNTAADELSVSFVPMSSMPLGILDHHTSEPRRWSEIKSGFTHFGEGDVGVAKITPCFENGKSTVFRNLTNGIGAGTTELHILRPLGGVLSEYILLFVKSPHFIRNGEAVMTGTAGQKRLPRSYFENTPLPLPPVAEQGRIVARVRLLLGLCAGLRQRLRQARTTQTCLADAVVAHARA